MDRGRGPLSGTAASEVDGRPFGLDRWSRDSGTRVVLLEADSRRRNRGHRGRRRDSRAVLGQAVLDQALLGAPVLRRRGRQAARSAVAAADRLRPAADAGHSDAGRGTARRPQVRGEATAFISGQDRPRAPTGAEAHLQAERSPGCQVGSRRVGPPGRIRTGCGRLAQHRGRRSEPCDVTHCGHLPSVARGSSPRARERPVVVLSEARQHPPSKTTHFPVCRPAASKSSLAAVSRTALPAPPCRSAPASPAPRPARRPDRLRRGGASRRWRPASRR